jgi:hypothetical protein
VIASRLGEPPPIQAMNVDTNLLSAFTEASGQTVTVLGESMDEAALRQAMLILAGHQRPWIEFRRGPLAIRDRLRQIRKPLDGLLATVALLLIGLSIVFFVRAARYARQDAALHRDLADAFASQFPGWSSPGNIKAVIESEHRKLSVTAAGAVPTEARASALMTMHAILTRLPAEGRFAVDHMTFDDTSFEMTGRLRSHEQVDALAAAARHGGFDLPPPQTLRNDDGTWTFTLRGARSSATPPVVAKSGVN